MKILIINSHGHWMNGWMTFPESLEVVVNVLQKLSCQVTTIEVQSIKELKQILNTTNAGTLVWANAYLVNGENGKRHGLPDLIQKHNLPMLGSNLNTLLKLLDKGICQKMLYEANIPVPDFLILEQDDATKFRKLIENALPPFPLVIKPTKESRSQGVTKVNNEQEAISTIERLFKSFPKSNIIIEEFLPTDDVTCGFLRLGNQIMILPSFNVVKGMDCSTEVFGEPHYNLPPSYEKQAIIHDQNILNQLQEHLPNIVDLFGIIGVTRIDARLDKDGILKFFDINGMPGLNYPISALVKQCYSHFPTYDEDYLFECLISTIVLENFRLNNMTIPPAMKENHLFNLNSKTIIKLKLKEKNLMKKKRRVI